LPVFSGQAARAEHREIGATLNHALRSLFFVMAPAALGLLVLARPIVEMIFQWNQFTARSTDLTAVALQFYAPGLLVFVLAKVFVPAFYAVQDTRTPVRIGLACVALNFTLNVIFILTWPLYLKHAGLALATVISEGFNGLALAWCFHRRFGSPGWRSLLGGAARALAAAALMALVVLAAHAGLVGLLAGTAAPAKLAQIAAVLGSIAIGMGSYLLVGWAARFPELQFVIEAVRRRRAGRPAEVSPTPGGPD
jgi:putative peptidoglycan lipid II flippase